MKYPYDSEERKVLTTIGNYFFNENLKKYKGFPTQDEMYTAVLETDKTVLSLGIHDLKIQDDQITITLERPGRIIGERGTVIDAIGKDIFEELGRTMKIKLEESNLTDSLTSYGRILNGYF